MLLGHHHGDAVGAPYEFNQNIEYTDIITHQMIYTSRFQGKTEYPIGIVTDDTFMSWSLITALYKHSLKSKDYYNSEAVVMEYMSFAESCNHLGKNTRALFKGIKTYKGYLNRYAKIITGDISQSNGSLMRAYPLAVLSTYIRDSQLDVNLTNPNRINIECELIYLTAIRMCLTIDTYFNDLTDKNPIYSWIYDEIIKYATENDVISAINDSINNPNRDLVTNRGWVCHALYSALYCLFHFDSLVDANRFLIKRGLNSIPKTDTDTNCAITGALLGAFIGYDTLISNPIIQQNYTIISNQQPLNIDTNASFLLSIFT